jgi:FixJ family two-component response regulator
LVRNKAISIIDDDESVRLATAGLARSLGFIAFTFASAEDFLGSSSLKDTSCLICDIQMPGMTGIELQDHLIAHGYQIPTIMITAFPEERVRKRALETGAVGFFAKPFDSHAMIRCIDSVIGKT